MQSVSSAFTAEEHDEVRTIASNLQVAWHRQSTLGNKLFTIGVSTIGGNDLIGITPGAIGSPGNYKYFDESAYITSLAWERGYNMPTGGISKAMAEARLDNTSGRFTPRYMGGNSELFTAILPSRPFTISAGFDLGADYTIPQFAGQITEQPALDVRSKELSIRGADYIDYFQNKTLDQAIMSTGQRTDQLMTTLSTQLGMSTAQYDYDTGINIIPFASFDVGIKFADAFHQLAEAENGQYFQDESGIFRFENRYHWQNSPYTDVQKLILTGQVINAYAPDTSHLVNMVEVNSKSYQKQPEQIIFRLNPFDSVFLTGNTTTSMFVNFDDPVLSMTTPTSSGTQSYFQAFGAADGTGTDYTSNITVVKVDRFAQSAKITFSNSGGGAYLTNLIITGRVARSVGNIYTKATLSSSLTAFNEQKVIIDNPFIQSQVWAESYAQMIVQQFGRPENLQQITIRAIPELQLGDLVSWQGRYWRVFDIKSTLDPSGGYIQDLTLLQRTTQTYFRIGVSTIGGADSIAP